jgi:hypothetical protein
VANGCLLLMVQLVDLILYDQSVALNRRNIQLRFCFLLVSSNRSVSSHERHLPVGIIHGLSWGPDCSVSIVVVVLVVGPISTAVMKASYTPTPMEFLHSPPEALHTPSGVRDLC